MTVKLEETQATAQTQSPGPFPSPTPGSRRGGLSDSSGSPSSSPSRSPCGGGPSYIHGPCSLVSAWALPIPASNDTRVFPFSCLQKPLFLKKKILAFAYQDYFENRFYVGKVNIQTVQGEICCPWARELPGSRSPLAEGHCSLCHLLNVDPCECVSCRE